MKGLITFCAAAILIMAAGSAHAEIIIDFDSLTHFDLVDNQFSELGADFNSDATVLDYLSSSTPPHSGSKVIFNFPSNDIRVDAIGSEWLMAGGYVTGSANVILTAYDYSNTLLGSDSTGGANIVGFGTPNIFLNISASNIAYVIFSIDTGNTFNIDDFTFVPVPVPAGVLLGMLGLGVAGMKLRKFV